MRALATIFKALSDETRLQMLGLLQKEGELCVCDFVSVLGVTQSKASRHLRSLVHAGLLEDRRDATWVHFRVADHPGPLQAVVLAALARFLPEQVPATLLDAVEKWRTCCPRPLSPAKHAARRTRRRPSDRV